MRFEVERDSGCSASPKGWVLSSVDSVFEETEQEEEREEGNERKSEHWEEGVEAFRSRAELSDLAHSKQNKESKFQVEGSEHSPEEEVAVESSQTPHTLGMVSTEIAKEHHRQEEQGDIQSEGELEFEVEHEWVGSEVWVVSEGIPEPLTQRFTVEPVLEWKYESEEVRNLLDEEGCVTHRDVEILDESNEVLGHVLGIDVFEEREKLHRSEQSPEVV